MTWPKRYISQRLLMFVKQTCQWHGMARRIGSELFFKHGYALQMHLVELDIQEEPKQ